MSQTPGPITMDFEDELLQEELEESRFHESGLKDLPLLKKLWPFVKPHSKALVWSVLLLPLITAAQMAQPFILRRAVDGPIKNGDLESLAWLCLAFLGLLVVHYGLSFYQMKLAQITGARIIYAIRTHLYDYLQTLSLRFYHKHPIGKLVTRITSDVENLSEMFSSGGIAILSDLAIIGGAIVGMFIMEWRLALLTCTIIPLLFGVMEFFRRRSRRAYDEIRVHVARMNAYLQENISGMEIIHLYRREKKNYGDFKSLNDENLRVNLSSVFYDSSLTAVIELLTHLTIVLVLWYGGQAILGGTMTFGLLVAFFQFVQMIFSPIEDVSEKYTIIQSGLASIDKIMVLLNETPDPVSPPAPVNMGRAKGAITFEHVGFGYDPTSPILKDLSFTIQPGEKVALVGPSGAGKTTIIKLLCRFYDVQTGRIKMDGTDIREMDLAALRANIVMIQQDDFLFSRTIAENVTLQLPDYIQDHPEAETRLWRALDEANAGQMVRRLPNHYDELLQERAKNLSSGERQLLLFARAIFHDPPILVLDEATSAIDPHTETLVQEAMDRLMAGRTTLLIAHRLSTIRKADKILVIDAGHLREFGSHEELMTQHGLYAKFYEYQQAMEGVETV